MVSGPLRDQPGLHAAVDPPAEVVEGRGHDGDRQDVLHRRRHHVLAAGGARLVGHEAGVDQPHHHDRLEVELLLEDPAVERDLRLEIAERLELSPRACRSLRLTSRQCRSPSRHAGARATTRSVVIDQTTTFRQGRDRRRDQTRRDGELAQATLPQRPAGRKGPRLVGGTMYLRSRARLGSRSPRRPAPLRASTTTTVMRCVAVSVRPTRPQRHRPVADAAVSPRRRKRTLTPSAWVVDLRAGGFHRLGLGHGFPALIARAGCDEHDQREQRGCQPRAAAARSAAHWRSSRSAVQTAPQEARTREESGSR